MQPQSVKTFTQRRKHLYRLMLLKNQKRKMGGILMLTLSTPLSIPKLMHKRLNSLSQLQAPCGKCLFSQ